MTLSILCTRCTHAQQRGPYHPTSSRRCHRITFSGSGYVRFCRLVAAPAPKELNNLVPLYSGFLSMSLGFCSLSGLACCLAATESAAVSQR